MLSCECEVYPETHAQWLIEDFEPAFPILPAHEKPVGS
jgi:hypothetical protein